MKIKRILTATAAAALVITSVFAGGNFKEVQAKDNDTPKKITLGYWESPNGELPLQERWQQSRSLFCWMSRSVPLMR